MRTWHNPARNVRIIHRRAPRHAHDTCRPLPEHISHTQQTQFGASQRPVPNATKLHDVETSDDGYDT